MHSPIKRNVPQHKKLKPCLVVFYDIRPGNGAGLCLKEKISKGGKKGKVEKQEAQLSPRDRAMRRVN